MFRDYDTLTGRVVKDQSQQHSCSGAVGFFAAELAVLEATRDCLLSLAFLACSSQSAPAYCFPCTLSLSA